MNATLDPDDWPAVLNMLVAATDRSLADDPETVPADRPFTVTDVVVAWRVSHVDGGERVYADASGSPMMAFALAHSAALMYDPMTPDEEDL